MLLALVSACVTLCFVLSKYFTAHCSLCQIGGKRALSFYSCHFSHVKQFCIVLYAIETLFTIITNDSRILY